MVTWKSLNIKFTEKKTDIPIVYFMLPLLLLTVEVWNIICICLWSIWRAQFQKGQNPLLVEIELLSNMAKYQKLHILTQISRF